jgi:membrane fusion protein (multidrug efflux system)
MKKKVVLSMLGGLAVILLIHHYRAKNNDLNSDDTLVQTAHVQEVALPQTVHAIGSLTARMVQISPEMPGYVKAILFKDGTFVKSGTALVQLDDTEYSAKHQTAEAQLVYTQKNYERMVTLSKRGMIAQNTMDELNANLQEKKANDEESESLLHKMKLTAPFDGVVGECKVNPGDYVPAGQGVVTLTDKRNLRIEYNLPENNLPVLKTGQKVTITTSAFPGKQFVGTLSYISPTVNVDNRSISVYADIINDTNELAPGMFVDVTQSLGGETKALMVPSRSLVPVMDGEQVYKVVDGKVQVVDVKIGQRTNELVEITQGISAKDIIITDGQFKVRNGSSVKTTA